MDNEMIERCNKSMLATPNASDYNTLVITNIIKAMHKPTDKQLNAARDWSSIKYGKPIGDDAAMGCWQAMIDAIIGEE